MGKVKRARQKFHLERVKSMSDLTSIEPKPSLPDVNTRLPSISVATNLFAGLDIPLGLDQACFGQERDLFDDAKSIVSTKSSFKDRNLSKKQKRTMRHDAFIQKLDIISQARKALADRKKKQNKKSKKLPSPPPMEPLAGKAFDTGLPAARQRRPQLNTNKSLLRSRQRQRQTLRDVGDFRTALASPAYRADPMAAISSLVHDKIRYELDNE